MLLEKKKVLVTGGSRGIGRSIVEACLKEGAIVHYISTKESPHKQDMEAIAKENSTEVVWHQGNVTDEEALCKTLETICKDGIDVVVNNAGITRDGLMFRMSTEQWNEVLNVNLTGAFLVARETARTMIRKRSGSIINISSVVGLIGNPGQTNYCASKAGLIGFTKAMAKECATRGVRVNALAPGFIETEMTEVLKDDVKDAILKQIPMGKMGSAEDIAQAIIFLASDKSTYITGQVLTVDGGMVM